MFLEQLLLGGTRWEVGCSVAMQVIFFFFGFIKVWKTPAYDIIVNEGNGHQKNDTTIESNADDLLRLLLMRNRRR
jgi:hypothetical protein